MILRRTHKSFRRIIPNPWNESDPRDDHFLAAERKHKYLFPLHYRSCSCRDRSRHGAICDCPVAILPCYACIRLRNRHGFNNYQVASYADEEDWDTLGAERAEKRICDECWEDRRRKMFDVRFW